LNAAYQANTKAQSKAITTWAIGEIGWHEKLMTPPSHPKPEIYEIYVDESSQTKHRYLILGGLGVPLGSRTELEGLLRAARLPELPAGEMAWTKVSRTKLDAYQRASNCFFDHSDRLGLEFHTLVIDTTKINDAKYNAGSRDIGFSKEVYQLLMKFRRLKRSPLFHVYLDERGTKQKTEEFRFILNSGARKAGDQREWPFRRVHFRDSASSVALQVVDVLLGALAFHVNGHAGSAGASPAKLSLSRHILARAGIQDVHRDTAIVQAFTIWHRQLRR
jgi:hypothetical protein